MSTDIHAAAVSPERSLVLTALHAASLKTGADFDYLLSTAMRESGLDADAKSKASSASGLFQFVDQTWLGLIKQYGGRHGLSHYADAIEVTDSGRYAVASAETKSAILALRSDPGVSALMAGEAANRTKEALQCAFNREICAGDLYAAHFLGEGAARRLVELKDSEPDARADLAFPQAAKANRSVFYNADGSAKSVGALYAWMVGAPAAAEPITVAPSVALRGTAPSSPPAASPHATHVASYGALPRSALLLSPAVVEILASLGTDHSPRRMW